MTLKELDAELRFERTHAQTDCRRREPELLSSLGEVAMPDARREHA
jgi:hypothetical protein